jgi:hypothetical protein
MENLRWWRRRWPWSLSGNGFRLPKIDPCDEFLESANLRNLARPEQTRGLRPAVKTLMRKAGRAKAESRRAGSRRPEAGSLKPASGFLLAEGVQHGGAADGEADYGSQRGDQQEVGAEVEDVGEYGSDREDESQYIEPERGANRRA